MVAARGNFTFRVPGSPASHADYAQIPVIVGSGGVDVLEGTAIQDGGVLADITYEDTIVEAQGGDDTLEGLQGNDTLVPGSGDDEVRGGAGQDCVAYYDSASAVTIDLASGYADATGGYDTISNVEHAWGSAYDDHLYGDVEDNVLDGGEGDDVLEGRDGDDRLIGEYDRVALDPGDDVLDGGDGDDTLEGGVGDDLLLGGSDDDTLDGGDGVDTASYAGATAGVVVSLLLGSQNTGGDGTDDLRAIENLTGSAYRDWLFGDHDANLLEGEDGDDLLFGNDGDDTLRGGLGDDYLEGGDGFDRASYLGATGGVIVLLSVGTASGADGADTLDGIEAVRGGAYDDVLAGDGSGNELIGAGGDDFLDGGAGSDTLDGGDDSDTASYLLATGPVTVDLAFGRSTGGGGFDTLVDIEHVVGSFEHGDTLIGNAMSNHLEGLAGDDTLDGGSSGADVLDGGDGFDHATWADAIAAVTIDLRAGTAVGDQDFDTLSSIERATGSGHGDVILGNAVDETLDGNGGDDTVEGGGGNDTLAGGEGVDLVRYLGTQSAVTVDLAAGTASTGVGRDAERDTLSGFENVGGTLDGGDTLSGDQGGNVLTGLGGDDGLRGRGGADTLNGGEGVDRALYDDASGAVQVDLRTGTASGAAGADTLAAIEDVTGSDGFGDVLRGDGGINHLAGGGGDDEIEGGGADDVLDGGDGIDRASYRDAASQVLADLQAGSAHLGAGDDTLTGFEDLTGSAWDDQLLGDAGRNLLEGLNGRDTFLGRGGADVLRGGSGRDTFMYTAVTDADAGLALIEEIVDFTRGSDRIHLANIDTDAAAAGDQGFAFVGTATFSGSGAEVRFSNGAVYADLDGDAVADLAVALTGVAAVTAQDFVL
jgi:Ca2+-binding RTX toxin-like protein